MMNNLDFNISSGQDKDKDHDDIETIKLTGDIPPDDRNSDNLQEKLKTSQKNQRALLQKFNIRVIVYPDRVEIKGAIPTQILDKKDKEKTARIICSPCQRKGGNRKRGLHPSGRTLRVNQS